MNELRVEEWKVENVTGGTEELSWLSQCDREASPRWVISRKVALVRAVGIGQISREEACRRFKISSEEFDAWKIAFAQRPRGNKCLCFASHQVCSACAKFFPVQSRMARSALKWTLEQAAGEVGILDSLPNTI